MSTQAPTLAPGAFCWVDLFTSDTAAAEKFYGALFGWRAEEAAVDPDGVYNVFKLDGQPAAGLMAITDEMKKMNVPPNWSSHVWVESAADRVKQARQLGGKILKEPCEAGDVGWVAVVQDPTGAVFCMWQPKKELEQAVYNVHGALTWNELWTPDPAAATKFYSALFGWTSKDMDFGQFKYTVVENQGRGNGGIMQLPKEVPAPPNWVVYFAVDDCDAMVEKVKANGGRQLVAPTDIPTIGRFAVLADPQGAAFAVIKATPM